MTFFYRPVELVELLILYASVQFNLHQALEYRLITQTVVVDQNWVDTFDSGLLVPNDIVSSAQ